MASHRQIKEARKAFWDNVRRNDPETYGYVCSNCGEKTVEGHFVPPSFRQKGFYTCLSKQDGEDKLEIENEQVRPPN